MSRIVDFADAAPVARRGRNSNIWPGLAAELRAAGKRAGKLDRKGTGISKAERERAKAAGLRIVCSAKHGIWIELLDTPAPEVIGPEHQGDVVTVAEFADAYRQEKGNASRVRAIFSLTLSQFEHLRAAARRDGLL